MQKFLSAGEQARILLPLSKPPSARKSLVQPPASRTEQMPASTSQALICASQPPVETTICNEGQPQSTTAKTRVFATCFKHALDRSEMRRRRTAVAKPQSDASIVQAVFAPDTLMARPLQKAPLPADRRVEFGANRIEDETHGYFSVIDEGYRDAPERKAARVVGGAVDRIDDPQGAPPSRINRTKLPPPSSPEIVIRKHAARQMERSTLRRRGRRFGNVVLHAFLFDFQEWGAEMRQGQCAASRTMAVAAARRVSRTRAQVRKRSFQVSDFCEYVGA